MTFSIIARDRHTGELGVAVHSHFLAVGRHVPWAAPGFGAVATQARVNPAYGAIGLGLLRVGTSAEQTLRRCLSADSDPHRRQVASIDAGGSVAAHTVRCCVAYAGHRTGPSVSVQANMVAGPEVVTAMMDAYLEARGPLPARLLDALDAGQQAGGDLRGQQSAALVVVSSSQPARPGDGVAVDLRVDDHVTPLAELRRLMRLNEAFGQMRGALDAVLGTAPPDAAALRQVIADLAQAQAGYGPNLEPTFWRMMALYRAGRSREADALLAALERDHPGWLRLRSHLTDAGWRPPR